MDHIKYMGTTKQLSNTKGMTRIKMLGASVLVSLGLSASVVIADEHTSTITQVTDSIYMLSGKGGNIGVMIGADGTFMIDDQYAPATPNILNAVKSVGGSAPKYLVNTHFHGDHTGGNENLGTTGTLILAHDNVRQRLVDGYEIAPFKMIAAPAKTEALPVVTFDSELGLHVNGDHIRVYHVANAHTDGDSIVQFSEANVIHTGDVFFNGFYPFIDVAHGGTVKGTIAAVNVVLGLMNEGTMIIPGHGPVAKRAELEAYRAMLAEAYKRLSDLSRSGKTLAEVQAQNPLADLQDQWGNVMFDSNTWIGLIYDGLD
jgi:glyoxylase-like metal-dependent hydrolase (beta-lactamase superfamily II)